MPFLIKIMPKRTEITEFETLEKLNNFIKSDYSDYQETANYITLGETNTIVLTKLVPGGKLCAFTDSAPYSAIDVEYTDDNYDGANPFSPRVRMEKPDESNTLCTYVWDGKNEDYAVKMTYQSLEGGDIS